MDKDRMKGKMKDIAGRVQRQAGEWSGDERSQAKGAEKQAEGKLQNLWGRSKNAARDAEQDIQDRLPRNEEIELETTARKVKSKRPRKAA